MSKIKFIFFLSFFLSKKALAFSCAITSPALVFPNYDMTDPNQITTTGFITVTCSDNRVFNYTISLSAGGGGNFFPRTMNLNGAVGGPTINYNLYYNGFPPGGTIWGDGSPGAPSLTLQRAHCHVNPCVQAIYGVVFPLQNIPIGLYSSNIVVRLDY